MGRILTVILFLSIFLFCSFMAYGEDRPLITDRTHDHLRAYEYKKREKHEAEKKIAAEKAAAEAAQREQEEKQHHYVKNKLTSKKIVANHVRGGY